MSSFSSSLSSSSSVVSSRDDMYCWNSVRKSSPITQSATSERPPPSRVETVRS